MQNDYDKLFSNVLLQQAQALELAAQRDHGSSIRNYIKVLSLLRSTGGSLVFSGVGKSGLIANKAASNFSSLGLPSFYLHPVEALHGDLGRLTNRDAIVMLSKSGTTEELLKLSPFLKIDKSMVIGLLGNVHAPLAKECGVVFDCSVKTEACRNNLAPTTSTTLTLAICDGLAVIYEELVDLSKEGFALNHPGGLLGKSLSLKVQNLMLPAAECAIAEPMDSLQDIVIKMTTHPVGLCAIVEQNRLCGILVEGDIRRAFATQHQNPLQMMARDLMNANPVKVFAEDLAFQALEKMEQKSKLISVLPVLDEKNNFMGVIRLHDLLQQGFVSQKNN